MLDERLANVYDLNVGRANAPEHEEDTRKAYDEYEIQGNNGYGWECETTEATYREAKAQAKCYRENVNYPIRIVKKRVKIDNK